jgi:hypothetical protein
LGQCGRPLQWSGLLGGMKEGSWSTASRGLPVGMQLDKEGQGYAAKAVQLYVATAQ